MRPDTPGNSGEGTSPNNKLNAATNEFRPNEAVPQIFGSPTAYPDFIQPSHYVYEDNVKIIREMFCIGEGRYQIDRILSGETDFDEIPNSSATVYHPGQIPPSEQRIIVRSTSEARGQGNIPLPAPNDKATSYTGDFEDIVASGQDSVISLIDTCNFLQDTKVKAGDFLECVIFQRGQFPTYILGDVYEIGAIDDTSTPKTITVLDTGGAEKNPNLATMVYHTRDKKHVSIF